jgi:shikimate kinase
MARACRVVLIGMMGSGKTSVGRLLAERTGWPLLDNDDLLRQLYDATPRQILARIGEAELLAAEVNALRTGLGSRAPAIVTGAAGTIVDPEALEALRAAALTVWLRVGVETVRRRAAGGRHRPWPNADRLAWIREAIGVRDPLYASVADLTLDADSGTPDELADRIMQRIEATDACRAWLTTPGAAPDAPRP